MKNAALRCAVTALLLGGLAPAHGADSYWYTGLGAGYSRIQFYPADFSSGGTAVESKKEFDAGFKGFIGHQMSRNWASELSYVSLGKFQYKYTVGNVTQQDDYKVTGWGVSLLPTVHFTNNFSLYGRLGMFASQARIQFYNAGGVLGFNPDWFLGKATSLLSGLGIQYFFAGDSGMRIEFENFGKVGSACTPSTTSCSGRANARMISFSAVTAF